MYYTTKQGVLQVKKYFILSNLIPLLLVVYILKSFFIEPSIFDFGVIFLMSIGLFHKLNLDKFRLDEKENLRKEIKIASEKLEAELDKLRREQEKDRLQYEGKISTINLALNQRSKTAPKENFYGWGQK